MYNIYRVIQQVAFNLLSLSTEESLIEDYLNCLHKHYNPQSDTYTRTDIHHIKSLTLHATKVLAQYKNPNLSIRDILIYSRLAISYSSLFNDKLSARKYLKAVEQIFTYQVYLDSDIAQVYANLEVLYYTMAEHSKSQEIRNIIISEYQSVLAKTYNSIGRLYYSMKDYQISETYYKRFLEIRTPRLRYDPDLATTYYNLGDLYYAIGKCIRKEQIHSESHERSQENHFKYWNASGYYYTECLKIRVNILSEEDPVLATTYHRLAVLYRSMGNNEMSVRNHLTCLEIRKSVQPRNDAELAQTYRSLGELYYSMEQYADSLEHYLNLLEIMKKDHDENSLDLAKIYEIVGRLYRYKMQYDDSEEYLLKCLHIWDNALHKNPRDRYSIYKSLWELYGFMENPEKAQEYKFKYLEIMDLYLSPDDPELPDTYIQLKDYYNSIQNYSKAAEYSLKYLLIMEIREPELYDYDHEYRELGASFIERQEYANSIECYKRCLHIRETKLGQDHPDLAPIYKQLGILHYHKRDFNRSEEHISQYLRIHESIQPPNPQYLASIYTDLSDFYTLVDDNQKADHYRMKSQEALSLS